jgi:SET domain-containing protein
MQKKENLIENLKNNTFCRVAASPTHGVGVFAVKDIPKRTVIFELCNSSLDDLVDLTEEDLKDMDEDIVKYVKDFFVKNDDVYTLPERGMNSISVGFYLNHSNQPNIIHRMHFVKGVAQLLIPVSFRDIKKGEELTENYLTLGKDMDVHAQFSFLGSAEESIKRFASVAQR